MKWEQTQTRYGSVESFTRQLAGVCSSGALADDPLGNLNKACILRQHVKYRLSHYPSYSTSRTRTSWPNRSSAQALALSMTFTIFLLHSCLASGPRMRILFS